MLTQEQLEWIVSEVVRRLRASEPTRGSEPSQPTAQSLTLTGRLVTLDTLRDRLSSITAVQVPAKAIVTPAVVDELKLRNIQLIRI